MDKFAQLAGRQYHLFDYEGHPEAERVIVMMGSGGETAAETAQLLSQQGEKVGVVKARLYRPFDARAFVNVLPPTVKAIAVLAGAPETFKSAPARYKEYKEMAFRSLRKIAPVVRCVWKSARL